MFLCGNLLQEQAKGAVEIPLPGGFVTSAF